MRTVSFRTTKEGWCHIEVEIEQTLIAFQFHHVEETVPMVVAEFVSKLPQYRSTSTELATLLREVWPRSVGRFLVYPIHR